MFTVERGIPLPGKEQPEEKTNQRYPWHLMSKGDSFEMALDGATRFQTRNRLAASAASWAKSNEKNRKYTCRQTEDGVRVWRTK